MHLLKHVQLHQAVHASVKVVNGRQLHRMTAADITDVRQPVVDQADALVAHRRLDTTAIVVANDQDVADLKNLDGILNDGQDVEVLREENGKAKGQETRRKIAAKVEEPEA